ncbi:MAG: Bax inhibitor-1/YccA family protein [Alphaproteobacteria bacterium]|nr:Bax inhibitor-1/YccA family protein [Alphaproteobacteria bacterium]MDE1985545.1 Bax inhibitor-1/YccA family protein [Alphaproteobacteria bacterium]MDE2162166.1 Bax inhibitor-1/YccA family protein [Alphaproteobacteria bacterium]MDE2266022.1 Bax inhibitor-1/YccA family protein [Alphaproteobacteria bacterium]MDE2501099.1 Bax inhibitor-1/YccA family protein [Alphaproteobacteria bacterium]
MADYDNRIIRGQTAEAGVIDAGLRAYMLRVYNYMLVGLALTGLTSYGVYSMSVTTDPAAAAMTLRNGVMLTSFGVTLFASPLQWLFMLAPLGAVLFINFRLQRMSVSGAQLAFWVFASLMGISLSTIFMVYQGGSIAEVFFITAAAFGGLSLYGYTTKRDLSAMGSFLIMGVWGLFIAMIVNIFLQSPMIMWVVSVLGVGIFAGLTAYDTQRIKDMYQASDDGTLAGKKAIMGALALYLDFINMFIFLLQLVGNRR